MRVKYITLLFVGFFLLQNTVYAEAIALVLRTRGTVQMTTGSNNKQISVRPGTRLNAGTKIITRAKSFAAIKFIDDASIVRVRPNSSCTIEGKRQKSGFFKNLFVDVGTIFCQVMKQKSIFSITTPTSVASVKGTTFWVRQKLKGETHYFGEEGIVEISNSKGAALLHAGETGYVRSKDAKPIVYKTKKGEKPVLDDDEKAIDEMEFEFRNKEGQSKTLKFKVKKNK